MSKVLNFVARQSGSTFAASMQACRSEAQTIPYTVRRLALATSDYTVENKGTLLLLRSTNARAYDWLVSHTEPEAHWFGRALVVEHGYIADFVDRLRCDGFSVKDAP